MCGAIPPLHLYVFMARCLVKHKDNFIFLFGRRNTKVKERRMNGKKKWIKSVSGFFHIMHQNEKLCFR
jgi:hypothetical protein